MVGNDAIRNRKMLYMLIKMSSKWYCKEVDSLFQENENIEDHCNNGEMVIFVDELETFCYEMKIKMENIEMV